MINNYGNFPDYQNNYENSNKNPENEKIVVVEKKKEREVSTLKNKFKNFTRLHWNEFKYTIFGLIISILFLTIGFFRTLLIIIFYLIGNIYGKYKDGDPKALFLLEKIFKNY
ncbi:MAG: DUF2273 domain-containing protein [Peptoniphilus harei]|jgi:hypothetical protein|uniref:DUF2273 domain-containing protein n=1 Tax=Peptoniphilus TaxID=162289 RepID=UPI0008DB2981|nr:MULTISPECIES: DUF2273 domain-containing protein [Peptoniphilus]MBS6610198.1 DUF2273 domain-containing protein [Peptoniphilus harei]MDU5594912.1 DUF2273 domain-containing protein [Peptoniphilus rhinitidis]